MQTKTYWTSVLLCREIPPARGELIVWACFFHLESWGLFLWWLSGVRLSVQPISAEEQTLLREKGPSDLLANLLMTLTRINRNDTKKKRFADAVEKGKLMKWASFVDVVVGAAAVADFLNTRCLLLLMKERRRRRECIFSKIPRATGISQFKNSSDWRRKICKSFVGRERDLSMGLKISSLCVLRMSYSDECSLSNSHEFSASFDRNTEGPSVTGIPQNSPLSPYVTRVQIRKKCISLAFTFPTIYTLSHTVSMNSRCQGTWARLDYRWR